MRFRAELFLAVIGLSFVLAPVALAEEKSEKGHRAVDGCKETCRSELQAGEPKDPAKNKAEKSSDQGDL